MAKAVGVQSLTAFVLFHNSILIYTENLFILTLTKLSKLYKIIIEEPYGQGGVFMYNAKTIAKWFLSKESMTHKKLQKLCYYAQAWYCALYDGSPLFHDDIQAWVHGPVVASLFPVYANYKWTPIPKCALDEVIDEQAVKVLEIVYDSYGGFSGDELERLTHSEDPWSNARAGMQPWETSRNVISTDAMRQFYRKMYEQAQND